MKKRQITYGVHWLGAIDWDRRLFDSLIPLPDGTSYNCYLIEGSEKNALVDTVDPTMTDKLMTQLSDLDRLDYLISLHAEQDHAGAIPQVLEKYPSAKLVANKKGKEQLINLLKIPEEKFLEIEEGDSLDLGDKTLKFIYTPWVHWPETMCAFMPENKTLFSCDFFGSHIATTDLYATDKARVYEAAKRYFAEIMMPFSSIIRNNLEKVAELNPSMIAPSHGPIHDDPKFIMDAYGDWSSENPRNVVVIPYTSMHGSTQLMVDYLVEALADRGVSVHRFELSVSDIGKLAITLVDAGTIVIGTPTVHAGPHPLAAYAASLANILKPKAKYASVIGSYGWGGKTMETIAALIPRLDVEVLDPVFCKGLPRDEDYKALDDLAETISKHHFESGFLLD
jgi:flavorubredoxin